MTPPTVTSLCAPSTRRSKGVAGRLSLNKYWPTGLDRLDDIRSLRLLRSSVLFDPIWYRQQYRDLSEVGDLTKHYVEVGARQGRNPHPLFDATWYLGTYPDIAAERMNPLDVNFQEVVHSARAGNADVAKRQ